MKNNNKVLIYMQESILKPVGGPSGYLFNLKRELDLKKIRNIHFLKGGNNSLKQNLKKRVPKLLRRYISNYLLISPLINQKFSNTQDFSSYECIHFHTTISMYLNRRNLENYKGKVLLSSHSPKPQHLEIIDGISEIEKKIYGDKLKKLKEIDEYSFNRADILVFPCEEAEEPYLNNWSDYSSIKDKKQKDYRYIPSGIIECSAKDSRSSILNRYNIPEDSYVICYVGRHNETKGYDLLKEVGSEILKSNKNVYFLIAGIEEPLTGLKEDRWIEVGWTSDPHSIISAADLFILPNKETYFDLVLLEVLSLGKIVLASDTGGNKFFKQYNSSGLLYFESKENAIEIINEVIEISKESKEIMGNNNFELFNSKFRASTFADNYIKLLSEILE